MAFVVGDVALKIWGGDSLKVPVPLVLRGAMELPGLARRIAAARPAAIHIAAYLDIDTPGGRIDAARSGTCTV